MESIGDDMFGAEVFNAVGTLPVGAFSAASCCSWARCL
jgi:hypothetical protein